MEYATKGTANTALGLSIGALGAELLTGGLNGIIGGVGGGGAGRGSDSISRETAQLMMENAILSSKLDAHKELADVVLTLNSKINDVVSEQTAVNAAQAVTNCGFTSAIAVAQNNISQLMGLTKLVVPSTNVCTGSTSTDATA